MKKIYRTLFRLWRRLDKRLQIPPPLPLQPETKQEIPLPEEALVTLTLDEVVERELGDPLFSFLTIDESGEIHYVQVYPRARNKPSVDGKPSVH